MKDAFDQLSVPFLKSTCTITMWAIIRKSSVLGMFMEFFSPKSIKYKIVYITYVLRSEKLNMWPLSQNNRIKILHTHPQPRTACWLPVRLMWLFPHAEFQNQGSGRVGLNTRLVPLSAVLLSPVDQTVEPVLANILQGHTKWLAIRFYTLCGEILSESSEAKWCGNHKRPTLGKASKCRLSESQQHPQLH